MRRLLVAVDFSHASDRALRRARLLAAQTGATLDIVHVLEADGADARSVEAARTLAEARLAELQETLRSVDGVAAQVRLETGAPRRALLAAADALDADLLVVGAPRPAAGLRAAFPSGTAERLARVAHRPVLVAAGVPAGPYERIFVATDFSGASGSAVQAISQLGLDRLGSVTVAHVFESALPALRESADTSIRDQAEAWIEAERARSAGRLEDFLGSEPAGDWHRVVEPNTSTPAATLLGIAAGAGTELIVIGSHGRSRLGRHLAGSVLADLVRAASVDLLIVPSSDPGVA